MTVAVAQTNTPEGWEALRHAAREAVFQGSPLAVLHISPAGQADPERAELVLRAQIQHTLDEAGYGALDWTLHLDTDEEGRAPALVALTERVAAGLLVIGSRRRTPIGKFLLGSTVQRVVLDSPVPVLVVKASPNEGASPTLI